MNTIASRRSSQLVFEGTEETRIFFWVHKLHKHKLHLLTFFGLRLGS